jgi:hypothetical protein
MRGPGRLTCGMVLWEPWKPILAFWIDRGHDRHAPLLQECQVPFAQWRGVSAPHVELK